MTERLHFHCQTVPGCLIAKKPTIVSRVPRILSCEDVFILDLKDWMYWWEAQLELQVVEKISWSIPFYLRILRPEEHLKQTRACVFSRFSCVWLFVTLWTEALQAPLSMGFSRQEYWSGCHALLQEIFLDQGSNPRLLCLLHWQVGSLPLAPPGKPFVS